MEENGTVRYTQFPNLNTTYEHIHHEVCLQTEWHEQFSPLPDEILIFAWANLLQAFTRISSPVFTLNGEAIQVDLPRKTWNNVQVELSAERRTYTALSLLPKKKHDGRDNDIEESDSRVIGTKEHELPDLAFRYSARTGSCVFFSRGSVPKSFLQELNCQLVEIVFRLLPDAQRKTPGLLSKPSLAIANAHRKILPGPQLLHKLMSSHRTSSATAIDYLSSVGERVQISYSELEIITDNLARQITNNLLSLGVSSTEDVIIPVFMSQCPELYCAWIAILKAGAAFCNVGLEMPAERVRYIIKDIDAKIVVALPESSTTLARLGLGMRVVEIRDLRAADTASGSEYHCSQRDETRASKSTAYVMYTSGSTGFPKAVMIPHSSVTQALLGHDEHVPEFHRFLQFAAPTFDVSVFETFFPLLRGKTLVSRHREHMLGDLPGTLRDLEADAAELTPTVAGTLLRSRKAVPGLKILLTIGEMLTRTVIEEFGADGGCEGILLPMYGPTEASIHCTFASSIDVRTKVGIIGRPLPTVTMLVIQEADEHQEGALEILGIGQVGELAVAGQLASGYLKKPDQTAVAFRVHATYGPVYRTGDRGRLLPSGNLECLGRMSTGQVKIRGQRVELGEIEQVVCRVEEVQSAIASIIDDVLVVFCVANTKTVTCEQIRLTCKSWLPSFMRPSDIVLVDRPPRLSSGKIDKTQIESNYRRRRWDDFPASPSSVSDLENLILHHVNEVLSANIARSDNLWSRGLDSLRSIKLSSALRDSGCSVSVADVMTAETVSDIVEAIDAAKSIQATNIDSEFERGVLEVDAVLAGLPSGTESRRIAFILPCSHLQKSLLAETAAKSYLNFNTIEVQLSEQTSVSAFANAFQRLAFSNNILRSGFASSDHADHPFVRIVWKELDDEALGVLTEAHDQRNGSTESKLLLLRPLRLQFRESAERRTCTVHIHHALYDGWSWDLIMKDLESLLGGKAAADRPQFDALLDHRPLQTDLDATQTYWQKQLRDTTPVLFPNLLTQMVRSGGRQSCKRIFTIELFDLISSSRHLHVSCQSIVAAAFAFLLSSYTGSSDVVFGAVSSGRTVPIRGIEQIIGPCINILPMRLDFSTLRTAANTATSAYQQYHSFLKFGNITLGDVKKFSGVGGTASVFQTLFVWQEAGESLQTSEKLLRVIDTNDSLDYPLVLEVEPKDNEVHAKISFETSKLPIAQVELFLDQLDSLMTVFALRPETPLNDCCSHIGTTLLAVENSDYQRFGSNFSLSSTIERLAEEEPHRTAVEFVHSFDPQSGKLDVARVSYGELYRRALIIGRGLSSKGISADDVVSIHLEKSIELYVAILGVVLAGAAYLAIDPRTPMDRIRRILEDSQCQVIIAQSQLQSLDLLAENCELCSMADLESEDINSVPNVSPPSVNRGEDLAYVVYTSGSTGEPKGVLITRNNILSNIDCLSKIYPTTADSCLLQACSQAFDVSVFEMFWTWHNGARLGVAANDVLFRDIEQLISKLEITHLSLTPSVAALIKPDSVPTVRFLVTAGEPMNSMVFDDWKGRGLYQGYGPSETTNICNVRPAVEIDDFPSNVGLPLPNTSVFICKGETFNLVPKGGLGEIWIGGDQVGRGYMRNQQLSSRYFVNHPLYGRLYRSGDVGRLLSDGSLAILGREDDQVKLRGQRIELGDINHALTKSAVVSDAFSLILSDSPHGHTRLVSFWTPKSTSSWDFTELQEQVATLFAGLTSSMPAYMIPDLLWPVPALPLTRQGKIDKRALTAQLEGCDLSRIQLFSRDAEKHNDRAPLPGKETKIAEAIATATGCDRNAVHRNTSFYFLGLDSINSIRLSRELANRGLGQVDVSELLRHSSVRTLADFLSSKGLNYPSLERSSGTNTFDRKWQQHVSKQYAALNLNVEKILPCTPLQEAMLSGSNMYNSGNSYCNRMGFRIHGDLAKLRCAWEEMVSRHQLLRTGFAASESPDHPFAQVVLNKFGLPWSMDCITGGPPESNLEMKLGEILLPPYSLTASQGGEGILPSLTLDMHHALYDGEAISLLLKEVEIFYNGGVLMQVVEFDRYLQYMTSLEPNDMKVFWRAQLQGYKSVLLSDLFLTVTPKEPTTYQISRLISSIRLTALEATAKRLSVTTLSILQASWTRLLCCYLKTLDICFGNVYSGRNLPVAGVDRIVGPCFNTLPMRIKLEKLQTITDLVTRVHELNLDTLPYQPSSLRVIQKHHKATKRPLFDNLLLLQSASPTLNHNIWGLVEDSGDTGFPIVCEIVPDAAQDRLHFNLQFESTVLSPPEAKRLMRNFDLLLQSDVQYTSAPSSDFSVLQDKLPVFKLSSEPQALSASADNEDADEDDAETTFSVTELRVREILSDASDTRANQMLDSTSIFHLGLDSINAVQIAARLRREGFNVTGGEVLEASTVHGIALLCDDRSAPSEVVSYRFDLVAFDDQYRARVCKEVSIEECRVEAVRPCTSTQSGILAEYISSDGLLYFNRIRVKIKKSLPVTRLKEAWGSVAARNEMLRTGFVQIDNADHPFAMVTYQPGTYVLPWKETNHRSVESAENQHGKTALGSLHEPPWYLLYYEQGDECYLQMSMLHALYDAQSLKLILSDVAAVCNGDDPPLPIPVGPSLSAILSRSLTQGQASMAFFSELGKSLQSTKFPDLNIYRNRTGTNSVVTRRCRKTQNEIRTKCQSTGISLQVAVQRAWAEVLASYTGQDSVNFGVIFSGRDLGLDDDHIVFPTVNTMPMSLDVRKGTAHVLREASRLNAALMQRQYTPLTKIKRWMNVEGKLFDTVVVLQRNRSSSNQHALWEVVSEEAQTEHVLSMEVVPDEQNRLLLRLTFKEDILPPIQAKTLLAQYEAILYATILSSDAEMGEISKDGRLSSIVPAKDKRIPTSTGLLHELVQMSINKWPDRIALEFAKDIKEQSVSKLCWTYTQLSKEANKVANLLLQQGAQAGDMIGICFDKCPEASWALLGILRAGCAFVALDPHAPSARKDFIIKDSGCTILLCNKTILSDLDQVSKVIALAIDGEAIAFKTTPSSEPPKLSRDVRPDDICYCLYTSGTTGTPKGCLITHDNAVQAMLSFQRLFTGHWDDQSRWLQFASFHFDVSVLEQFWSWSVGICVTSASRDLLFADLPGAISSLKITHLDLTPSLAGLIKPEDVPSLCRGVFITGGEQLRQDVLDVWGDVGVLYNFYGPSEVTIGCTVHKQVPKIARPSNIGQQFDNVGTFVIDLQTHRPVLRGAVGELCLSGPLVGKGYLNRPELTEAKFEHLAGFDVRVYHTGDLVRLLHDGSFDFLGRADDQVKLRGQRLEIGEINTVIRQSDPSLKDIATIVMRHPQKPSEQLVSFLSWAERSAMSTGPAVHRHAGTIATAARIRQDCISSLPGYMVPTYFIPISAMPLSANNKAELNRLGELFAETSVEVLQELSAQNSIISVADQAVVDKIVDHLSLRLRLPRADIKPSSNLFELGMDSVSVIGFAKSLKDAGFAAARPSLIMKYSTISSLATALEVKNTASDDRHQQEAVRKIDSFAEKHRTMIVSALKISGNAIETIAPCTPLQEGMLSRVLSSAKVVYMPTFIYKLSDSVDLQQLQDAWSHVQMSNQILRTSFVPTEDGYAQVVLSMIDSHRCSIHQRHNDDEVQKVLQRDSEAWHDSAKLLHSMLWRVTLVEGGHQKVMVLHMFHALFDGISLDLLLGEVARAYNGTKAMPTRPKFHDILSYGPLRPVDGAKAFWQKHIVSSCLLNLPVRHEHLAKAPANIATLSMPYVDDLQDLRRRLRITEPALFHAAWLIVLCKHFGFVPTLGIVVSGRSIDVDGVQNVIGPLFNTLPCFIDFGNGFSFSDLARACHDFNVDSLPFQHTPLRDIAKWLQRDSRLPFFDSLFVFNQKAENRIAPTELWSVQESLSVPDFPLAIEVQRNHDNSWTVTIVAQPQFLKEEELHELLSNLHETVRALVANPERPLPSRSRNLPKSSPVGQRHDNGDPMPSPSVLTTEADEIRHEVAILADVDSKTISGKSSIFKLGLDSIDAIKLSARLKRLGIYLPVSTILRAATIEAMADVATRRSDVTAMQMAHIKYTTILETLEQSVRTQNIEVEKFEHVLPVTPLQEGMLANFERYYSHDILELESNVDIAQLKAAWEDVIQANPILRTSFIEIDDPSLPFTYVQLPRKTPNQRETDRLDLAAPGDGQYLDWCQLTITDESEIEEITAADLQQFSKGGLEQSMIRLILLSFESRRILVLGMSHIIYDGWSVSLLHEDVLHRYNGLPRQRPNYEPALRHMLQGEDNEARDFWENTLCEVSSSTFPRNERTRSGSASTLRKEIRSIHSANSVQTFCKAQGVTTQALGLACYSIVLAGKLRQTSVCFGLVLSGRTTEDFDQMMFPTMNTIIFSTSLKGRRSEMLRSVHDHSIRISEHQFFPLRKAKAICGIDGRLFDSLFIFQKRLSSGERFPELYHSIQSSSSIEYPVNVEMEVDGVDLIWRTACQAIVMTEQDVAQLLNELDLVLGNLMNHPEDPVTKPLGGGLIELCEIYTINEAQETKVRESSSSVSVGLDPVSPPERSRVEVVIRKVLASVSGMPLEQISRTSNLFSLGLDSITSIKVSSMLKRKSISLPVSKMLTALTVERMAAAATPIAIEVPTAVSEISDKDQRRNGSSEAVVVNGDQAVHRSISTSISFDKELQLINNANIRHEEVDAIMSVTGGQSYALGAWSASTMRLFYSIFFYEVKSQNLSVKMLEKAWAETIDQLPILRTTFVADANGRYLQVVLKNFLNPVEWLPVGNVSTSIPANTEGNYQNDALLSAPVKLFAKASPSGISIRLKIHHALYDAVSLPMIIRTLETRCHEEDRIIRGPPEAALVDFLTKTMPFSAQMFWIDYLNGYKGKEHSQSVGTFSAQRTEIFRSGLLGDVSLLERSSRSHGLSFQSLFLAAFANVYAKQLQHHSDQAPPPSTVAIGVYLANRSLDIDGLPDLAHPTFNVVPLRIELSPVASVFDVATKIQRDLGEISKAEHCGVSLQEIYDWTGVRLDCFVNFLKLPEAERGDGGGLDGDPGAVKFEAMDGVAMDMGNVQMNAPSPFTGEVPSRSENDVFLPSIDVEARIRRGGLDVGLFAPEDMLDAGGAELVLGELKALLLSVGGGLSESGLVAEGRDIARVEIMG